MSPRQIPSFVVVPMLGLLFAATHCTLEELHPPLGAGGTSVGAAGQPTTTTGLGGSGSGGSATGGAGGSAGTTAGTSGASGSTGGGGSAAGKAGAGGSTALTDGGGTAGSGGQAADGGGDATVSGDGGGATFAAVKMLLTSSCAVTGCHGNNGGTMHIDFRDTTGLYTRLMGQAPATAPTNCKMHTLITPSMPAQSFILAMVGTDGAARLNCGARMPDGCPMQRPCLTAPQIQLLTNWVSAGAPQQ